MNEITGGTLEWYSYDDYIIGNNILEQAPSNFWEKKIEYNQNLVHKNSCFIHGPCGAISDLLGIEWTTEEIKEIVNYAFTQSWADPSFGGYFQPSINLVAEYARKKTKKDIGFYRLPTKDFQSALNRGYSIVTGYGCTKNRLTDKNDDGILNFSTGAYGASSGGHCIRITKHFGETYIVDNYKGLNSHNIYKVDSYAKQITNGNAFSNGYIYINKEAVKDGFQGMNLKQKIEKLRNR